MDLLTGTGRVGRLNYFATSLIVTFVFLFTAFATSGEDEVTGETSISPFLLLVSILTMWLSYTNMIRRLHDLGRSGWMSLLTFVPLLGFALGLYLLFAPGDSVRNRYGLPPGSNGGQANIDAQRERMELIAAAAGAAYRAKGTSSYLNDDGSFNMQGLSSESSLGDRQREPTAPAPSWAPEAQWATTPQATAEAPPAPAAPPATPPTSHRPNPPAEHHPASYGGLSDEQLANLPPPQTEWSD